MGWAFRAEVPVVAVREAGLAVHRPLAVGVRGWRGTWIVNGSRDRIVVLGLAAGATARVAGIEVAVRRVAISVDAPDLLITQVTGVLV